MRESEEGGFALERLDVYRRAVEFLVVVTRMISELPSGNASWTDPLRRAALCVPVHVAEGVGRSSAADRRRPCAIARGSAKARPSGLPPSPIAATYVEPSAASLKPGTKIGDLLKCNMTQPYVLQRLSDSSKRRL